MTEQNQMPIEDRLYAHGLHPIAFCFQNATTAREPVERFNQWMYLYETILKSLTSLAWSRSRVIGDQPPELLFFIRDAFRQTSQGHWLQLLSACRDHLKNKDDSWGRFLDGALRKKLRDDSFLEVSKIVDALMGHSSREVKKVSLLEYMQTLTELRNKTQGHGAPRRHFYEDINPHFETSIMNILGELEQFITYDLLYVERLSIDGEIAVMDVLLLRGTTRRPWHGQITSTGWLKTNTLLVLDETEDGYQVYPLDPLMMWDERTDAVCIYNAYVESRQQFEYLSYTSGEPIHVRGRSFEAAFGLPVGKQPTFSRGPMKLWSDKGVALYPVDTPLVGQNSVFNALVKFRRKFNASTIAGFFALIGDWGLGKSRIGFELSAESFGHVDRWLVNPSSIDYVIANTEGRVLSPGISEGILPLFVRYDMVCDDDLLNDNWIPRVATDALALVVQGSGRGRVPDSLLQDVRTALITKSVDFDALQEVFNTKEDYDERLEAALDILRPAGIEHLWVVVDELETLTDYRRGLPEDRTEPVGAEYLTMVADVFRHEHYRAAKPYYANVHFLLLCSEGMRDKLEVGPIRRRDDVFLLTPNRLSDVQRYVEYLSERAAAEGQSLDYPEGTVEAAFLASNRNFGWFNVMMSSIHQAYQQHLADGEQVTAPELIKEFAMTEARARWIFDTSGLDLLQGISDIQRGLIDRLVFGQLPIRISEDISESQSQDLLKVKLPGLEGPVFAELMQVHIDAGALAQELVRPEVGFRLVQETTGTYYAFYNTRLNVKALIAAFQAFSVATGEEDILVYSDPNQFAIQLKALYPETNIEQAADALYQIFRNAQVHGYSYLAASFPLLQRVDKLLSREVQRTTFFRNPDDEVIIEQYLRELLSNDARRQQAICEGFAKLLDENLNETQSARGIQAASVSFKSTFQSPSLDSLRVTPGGRLTVIYCRDGAQLAADLSGILGQQSVHPIVVLLPPHADPTVFEQAIVRMPAVQRCVIVRRLNSFEEDFLLKYSGRGNVFTNQPLSDWSHSRIGAIREEWKRQADEWNAKLQSSGYLLHPIWYTIRGIALEDFYQAYRLMLANNWSIDEISPEMRRGFDETSFAQVENACRKNVETPANKPDTLSILSNEPYRPTPPPAFGTILYELRHQASLESLSTRFFFAGVDDVKPVKQLEQILELLRALGLAMVQTESYRAINNDLLRQYREATAVWLNGACRNAIEEIRDIFPEPAKVLEEGELRFATDDLRRVEGLINQVNLGPLASSIQVDQPTLSNLVGQIQDIETTLQKICPPGIYRREGQTFQLDPDQIQGYESRYNNLSLWEKVNFLRELRNLFAEHRSQLIEEIQSQLTETQNMQTVGGHPFPIAALTIPLKSIEQELTSATGGTISLSGRLEISGYPYELRRYLLTGKYEDAWHRLDALGSYVNRNHPNSIWLKFKLAHDRWQTALRQFNTAQAAWTRFSKFMQDAPESAWREIEQVRADYQDVQDVVAGGLAETIQGQVKNLPALQLITELNAEVDGYAVAIEGLAPRIETAQQDVLRTLKAELNLEMLRALNEVLRALNQSEVRPPDVAETYNATKQRFEAYNTQLNDRGLELFDRSGRTTTWSLWLDIYPDLVNESFVPQPDHRPALDELEEMGVVMRTVKLKR